MISHLKATGVKGQHIDEDLARVTIFVGENASGKSARLDAIYLATLGYHPSPEIGKQGAGILELCPTRDRIDVEIQLGDRDLIARNWTKVKDSVKCSCSDPVEEFPELMLVPQIYFGLSAAKRIELVASMVTLNDPQFTVTGILAAVKNIKLEEGKNNEASEAAILDVYNDLAQLPGQKPLLWLEAAINQTRDSLKAANASKKRMVAVNVGLEQLRAQDHEAEIGTGNVERDLAAEREKLAGLQTDSGALQGRIRAAARGRARKEHLTSIKSPEGVNEAEIKQLIAELDERIAKGREYLASRPQTTEQLFGAVSGLEAKQGSVSATLLGLAARKRGLKPVAEPVTNIVVLRAECERNTAAVAEITRQIEARGTTLDQLREALSIARLDQKQVFDAHANAVIERKQVEQDTKAVMEQTCCPICNTDNHEWKERYELKQRGEMARLDALITTLNADKDRLLIETGACAKRLHDAGQLENERSRLNVEGMAKRNALETEELRLAQIAVARAAYDTAVREIAEGESAALVEQARLQNELTGARAAHQKSKHEDDVLAGLIGERDGHAKTLSDAAIGLNQYRSAQAELASLSEPETQESLAHEQEQLDIKAGACRTREAELSAKQRTIIALRGDLKRQMEAAAEAAKNEAEVEVFKAAGLLLTELQAKLVERAFKPLLTTVNHVTSSIIPFEIEYRGGKLGYQGPMGWVSSATFNGAWKALLFIGFAAALSQGASERLVIFDEMVQIIGQNKRKVIERVLELISDGTITQFVGNDGDGAPYAAIGSDKIKIINV